MQTTRTLRRGWAALAVAGATAALTATAFAAPAHEGSVSAAAPVFSWDGGPASGSGQGVAAVRCTPGVYSCEDALVEVKDAGDLTAEIIAGEGANDLDVAILKSDADGTAPPPGDDSGSVAVEDTSTNANAKATLKKAAPGFYIIRVRIFDGINAVWKGTASLKVPTPPAPAPTTTTPPATTQPAPAPAAAPPGPSAKERRNACIKKAKKKFKGKKNAKKRKKALKRCKKIK